MPVWAIVLIVVGSVLLLEIIVLAIIHRHVLKAAFKGGPKPKAPKWHVWVPKKHRVQ